MPNGEWVGYMRTNNDAREAFWWRNIARPLRAAERINTMQPAACVIPPHVKLWLFPSFFQHAICIAKIVRILIVLQFWTSVFYERFPQIIRVSPLGKFVNWECRTPKGIIKSGKYKVKSLWIEIRNIIYLQTRYRFTNSIRHLLRDNKKIR